jgi:hypothetical protein
MEGPLYNLYMNFKNKFYFAPNMNKTELFPKSRPFPKVGANFYFSKTIVYFHNWNLFCGKESYKVSHVDSVVIWRNICCIFYKRSPVSMIVRDPLSIIMLPIITLSLHIN